MQGIEMGTTIIRLEQMAIFQGQLSEKLKLADSEEKKLAIEKLISRIEKARNVFRSIVLGDIKSQEGIIMILTLPETDIDKSIDSISLEINEKIKEMDEAFDKAEKEVKTHQF